MRVIATVIAAGSLCVAAERPAAVEQPNVILIMVDDMGRDWIGCYGSDHPTPNVDRLAERGLRYETAWSNPICTPTRVTLLTGQYAFRHGWTRHHDVPRWGGEGLSPKKFTTFAKVLREAGYSTAIGGKWQVNHLREQPDVLRQHGFDEHCVWTGAERGLPESGERYFNGYLQTNGKRATAPYGPDRVNAFLIDFIKRHRKGPFLVYYPMLLTHGPFGSTPLNKDDLPGDKTPRYAAYVTYMDRLVGRLVDEVDRLGISKNTLIVFTGDNGSSAAGTMNKTSYVKGKGRQSDAGAHVPFIVRAPFLIKYPGYRSKDLVDFTDLYPTFVELAGAKLPAGVTFDGVSLVPSLKGDEDPFKKRNWIYSQIGDFRMVRDWKYLLDNKGGFYDVQSDPRQEKNLFESGEKIIPGRRERMKLILGRFPADGGAPFAGYGKIPESKK